MNFYQINAPVFTNSGLGNYETARQSFEGFLVLTAGGFTRHSLANGFSHGEWFDETTKKTHKDAVVLYYVACQAHQFDAIVDKWFELFPDQEAVFTAKLGQARITRRPEREEDATTKT